MIDYLRSSRGRFRTGWRIRRMLIENSLSSGWVLLSISCAALILLPLDPSSIVLPLSLIAATIVLGVVRADRVIAISTIGVLSLFGVSYLSPLLNQNRIVYFVDCPKVADCLFVNDVTESGYEARIYPVFDPIKWWLWKTHSDRKNFRWLEVRESESGEFLIHSPIERALVDLRHHRSGQLRVRLKVRTAIPTVTLNTDQIGYKETRRPLLDWHTPIDIEQAGAFSSVSAKDDLWELSREVVRNDLILQALLQGKLVRVWESTDENRERTIRELVRDNWISSAIFDRSIESRVFSQVRLKMLAERLPQLSVLKEVEGDFGTLFASATLHYANMLRGPGGLPYASPKGYYEPRDLERFDDKLLFMLLASVGNGFGNVESQADRFAENWSRVDLDGNRFTDPSDELVEFVSTPGDFAPFSRHNFSLEFVKDQVDEKSNKLELKRVLYAAIFQLRETVRPILSGLDHETDFQFGVAERKEILALLSTKSHGLDPVSKLIIDHEINALRSTLVRIDFLDALKNESAESFEFFTSAFSQPDSLVHRIMMTEEGLSALNKNNLGTSCRVGDDRFLAHFIGQWISLFAVQEVEYLQLAKPHMWRTYGTGGVCPNFLPGVMLTHVVLSLTSDERAKLTREAIDDMGGYDAEWMLEIYKTYNREDLFEPKTRNERILGVE